MHNRTVLLSTEKEMSNSLWEHLFILLITTILLSTYKVLNTVLGTADKNDFQREIQVLP